LRPLSYPDSNVILMCYSVDCDESRLNLERKWVHELDNYCRTVPRLVVACKSDLRPAEENSIRSMDNRLVSREAVIIKIPTPPANFGIG
jgi:GTPase SAR1 family protein